MVEEALNRDEEDEKNGESRVMKEGKIGAADFETKEPRQFP